MRTKLVYVLASTENDLFYEQCLISVYSAQLYNPNIKIVLVVDNKTHSTLKGNRKEITDYVDDIIVKDFPEETSMFMRSRLLKVELRSLVKGDYLYVDCDTLIVDSLESIDLVSESIAAVLDGHVKLKNHPTYALFKKQCDTIGFPLSHTRDYFNGGVIFAKDDEVSHNLYSLWHNYYLSGTSSNISMDQPSFNKSNYENNSVIKELPGEWNCQVRFGAKYIASAKVLHFCSKKNMPLASIASRNFLYKVKKYGLNAPDLNEKVRNWKNATLLDGTLCTFIDYSFVFSKEYENARKKYVQDSIENQIRQYRRLGAFYKVSNSSVRFASPSVIYRSIRNSILGRISMKHLSSILFREKLGKEMPWENPIDFNEKITWLAFNSDITIWSELADKYRMRKFIEKKGFGDYLPEIYNVWSEASQINFSNLPQSFVIKCNHDNGSSIIVKDQYSIERKSIVAFFNKRLKHKFGISTAEPHYQQISPVVMAEELINNDSDISDSIIDYKFFAFEGFAPYCQVVFNQKKYEEHISDIYRTNPWCKYNEGNNSKYRSSIEVPRPIHLDEMLNMISVIGKNIRFCRIDLYETKNKIYIGEITFMPGCGRISSFSQSFLNELGGLINLG